LIASTPGEKIVLMRRKLELLILASVAACLAWPATALAADATGASAETEPKVCTEIGCTSGIAVRTTRIRQRLPKADRFEVCLNRECHTFPRRTDFAEVNKNSIDREKRVRVKLRVMNRDGEIIHRDRRRVRLNRVQPNGPGCPPVCYRASLGLDRKLRLTRQ
jgi:hypothetical protein